MKTALVQDRWHPNYDRDPRFTPSMWQGYSRNRGDAEWRSYALNGEEVARVCLGHTFSSHDGQPRALLIDKFEVRADLRGDGLGLAVIRDVVHEHRSHEIYAGPTPSSWSWWEDKVGWPRCLCEDCDGQARGFVVRRP
jgi:hypothetical protein